MAKFRKKPVVIEAITFDDLVEHGRANSDTLNDEMPWSFKYQGQPITHENDNCYLIPTLEGTMKFMRGDWLITGVNGEIYPCKLDIFEKTYESVDETRPDMPPVFWSTPEEFLGQTSKDDDIEEMVRNLRKAHAYAAGWRDALEAAKSAISGELQALISGGLPTVNGYVEWGKIEGRLLAAIDALLAERAARLTQWSDT